MPTSRPAGSPCSCRSAPRSSACAWASRSTGSCPAAASGAIASSTCPTSRKPPASRTDRRLAGLELRDSGGALALLGGAERRPGRQRDQPCGVDERHVRQGLRIVAEHPPLARVVFLGQEAEVVAEPEQPLEERLGVLAPAQEREVVREPEGARQ